MLKREGKRGQLTVLIIVALVIVAGILIYFFVKNNAKIESVPAELAPIYSYYDSCIEEQTREAIDIAGTQGGKIYIDSYDPASDYAPFSSQLNFLGFPVPYWYYVSGNGLIKEQVPTKNSIQEEIARYVDENIGKCNFDQFYQQGYDIGIGKAVAEAIIDDTKVSVTLNSPISVSKGEGSAKKSVHKIEVNSKLGKFYTLAKEIYDKQKNEAFLENYSLDVLYNYAPVDGVEVTCSPKIWKTREVVDELKKGLEANIDALKFEGGNYELKNKEEKYFVIDKNVDENVNMLYSSGWPTKISVVGQGVDNELMVAETVGNQQGLGMMGFCYAPYHFVYDVSFPVMVQIYDNEELFQFPFAVIIDKNMPRKAIFSNEVDNETYDLCAFKTQNLQVNVYDVSLQKKDAEISYGCFDQKCDLGKTQDGIFVGKAPACVNGYLYVKADNYTENKQMFSTNSESSADVILDKEFDVKISLEVGGKPLNGQAIVIFDGVKSVSAALPDASEIKLSEGSYNVSVYVYGNSSIIIPESKKTQCTEVPQSGISGFFGGTKEQCFDITLPETKIDYALMGGGKSETYLFADSLAKGELKINVNEFKNPASVDDLQYNYELFDQTGVEIEQNIV